MAENPYAKYVKEEAPVNPYAKYMNAELIEDNDGLYWSSPSDLDQMNGSYMGQAISSFVQSSIGKITGRDEQTIRNEAAARANNYLAVGDLYNTPPSNVRDNWDSYQDSVAKDTGLGSQVDSAPELVETLAPFAIAFAAPELIPAMLSTYGATGSALMLGGGIAGEEGWSAAKYNMAGKDYEAFNFLPVSEIFPEDVRESPAGQAIDAIELLAQFAGPSLLHGAATAAGTIEQKTLQRMFTQTLYTKGDPFFLNIKASEVREFLDEDPLSPVLSQQTRDVLDMLKLTEPQFLAAAKTGLDVHIPANVAVEMVPKTFWGKIKPGLRLESNTNKQFRLLEGQVEVVGADEALDIAIKPAAFNPIPARNLEVDIYGSFELPESTATRLMKNEEAAIRAGDKAAEAKAKVDFDEEIKSYTAEIGDEIKESSTQLGSVANELFVGINRSYDTLAQQVFGGPGTKGAKTFLDNIVAGRAIETKYIKDRTTRVRDALEATDWQNRNGIPNQRKWVEKKFIESPKAKDGWFTKGQAMAIYMHAQNPDNLAKLLKNGIQFREAKPTFRKPKEFDKSTKHLTESEVNDIVKMVRSDKAAMEYISITQSLFKQQGKDLNAAFQAINRQELKTLDNYYPISAARKVKPEPKTADEALRELEFELNARAGVNEGLVQERVSHNNPIYIDDITTDIDRSIRNTASYIGLKQPVAEAARVLEGITPQVEHVYGRTMANDLKKGLSDVLGERNTYNELNSLMRGFRNNFAVAALGVNPFVMVAQFGSFPLYGNYVKSNYLLDGFIETRLGNTKAHIDVIKRFSPTYARRLEGGQTMEMADLLKSKSAADRIMGNTDWRDMATSGISAVDEATVTAGMWSAHLQAMDEMNAGKLSARVKEGLGITDAEIPKTALKRTELSFKFADYATQNTQPMFDPIFRSKLQRSGEIGKLATQFSSATNRMTNLLLKKGNQFGFTSPEFYQALFTVQVLNGMMIESKNVIRDFMYGRDVDLGPERIITAQANTAAAQLYGVRDIMQSAMSKWKYGTYAGGEVEIPITSFINDGVGAAVDITKGFVENDQRAKERGMDAMFDTLLLGSGIPTLPKRALLTITD